MKKNKNASSDTTGEASLIGLQMEPHSITCAVRTQLGRKILSGWDRCPVESGVRTKVICPDYTGNSCNGHLHTSYLCGPDIAPTGNLSSPDTMGWARTQSCKNTCAVRAKIGLSGLSSARNNSVCPVSGPERCPDCTGFLEWPEIGWVRVQPIVSGLDRCPVSSVANSLKPDSAWGTSKFRQNPLTLKVKITKNYIPNHSVHWRILAERLYQARNSRWCHIVAGLFEMIMGATGLVGMLLKYRTPNLSLVNICSCIYQC
uniref:Uncharacterized protein n=1 Tax=Strigamia maritima TaxID=126957 RepID=T1JFV3_STRMM